MREDEPVLVTLREQVIRDLDDQRQVIAGPLFVERRVVVVQHSDQVQRRIVVDVEIVGRFEGRNAAHVLDHQPAVLDEPIEHVQCVPAELRQKVVVAVHEPRCVARHQNIRRR
jgi:hypothetical protein